ncbi:MAG: hypothetical protein COZ27_01390 [Candidatus Moranbacteria bacterium CG_4_10_14_3_um_filter_41_65]|nr:MAG: hypothetical protein AUK58_02835 [Candidatus Moranbacteria bacterium CG2_30_41_165]PIP25882.1 MAG: hypothetical protein COX32_01020 [Candidatus Moranbacteria bacterium CG23_combo_of_CG06-09_8_20_14_all_41_28]PIV86498.1 MAG: hypothetical protein COW50_01050 [Candidatus Moranbacteria bacterium CG17_big_fil_post_rev_8_21_14_2_50_41_107]PIW94112.1 MAG: hypothetical protein COZ86_02815 [Candidatus Moranbacteria bacterium CG_4_8_14_3_um_filter_41_13]PIX91710.1 MAG: hypothetical protein COZ27_
MTDYLIKEIGQEVFCLLMEPGVFSLEDFKKAFADVAHKHDIWHHKEKEQYNYFFRQAMKEVKRLIKNKGNAKKIRAPVLNPSRLQYNRNLDF